MGGDLRGLYAHKLLGGGYEDWLSGRGGDVGVQIEDIQRQMGLLEKPRDFDWYVDTYGYKGGADEYIRAMEQYGQATGAFQEEITRLEGLRGEAPGDITLPFGAIGEVTPARQRQIGELTGSFEELGRKGIEESYGLALEDLARRGVTGGTPEFEMIQRESEAYQTLRNEAIQFGDWISRQDDSFKMQLLGLLESGMQAGAALDWQKQQAGISSGLAQQQLQQQQAQWGQQMDWQRQQALQNTLAMLGQGIGGMNWGGRGGGGAGANLAGSPYYSSPGSFLTRPMPTAPQYF